MCAEIRDVTEDAQGACVARIASCVYVLQDQRLKVSPKKLELFEKGSLLWDISKYPTSSVYSFSTLYHLVLVMNRIIFFNTLDFGMFVDIDLTARVSSHDWAFCLAQQS